MLLIICLKNKLKQENSSVLFQIIGKNERKNKRTKEQKNEGTNKRTKERTKERRNERKNERTNEREESTILTYSYQSGNYVVSAHQNSLEKVFLRSQTKLQLMRSQTCTSQLVLCFVGPRLLIWHCSHVLLHLSVQTSQMKMTTEAEENSSRQQL